MRGTRSLGGCSGTMTDVPIRRWDIAAPSVSGATTSSGGLRLGEHYTLTEGKERIQEDGQRLLQEILNRYQVGLEVAGGQAAGRGSG